MPNIRERLKSDDFFNAVNEIIADGLNKLLAGDTKYTREANDLKLTAYWVGDQIRIDIK